MAALKTEHGLDYIYTCGPTGMIKAIENTYKATLGQVSHEEHMACGFGVCMACVCKVNQDDASDKPYKRLCVEGPVLKMGEMIYEA
jgi:dihydroorotate dehydrogenase electron transfer subunit